MGNQPKGMLKAPKSRLM